MILNKLTWYNTLFLKSNISKGMSMVILDLKNDIYPKPSMVRVSYMVTTIQLFLIFLGVDILKRA